MNRRAALRSLALGLGSFAVTAQSRLLEARHVVAPGVETTGGRIRGYVAANGVQSFKGVWYGANTAARRFLSPVAVVPWAGVRESTTFGPVAPQPGMAGREMSEDCLHLNLWTPAIGSGQRPVLVWFHPGAYSSGTSNEVETDGARLSRRGDVVVVTVNHRVNAFGHLFLAELAGEEFADSGNAGLLDLVLALEWVRDNVSAFGGDSANVTVFGQSGGGAKIATLMAMPAARGLFHAAMTMSGQQITASRTLTATRHATQLLNAAQIPAARVRELCSLSTEHLIKLSRSPSYLGPVRDGRSLPRDPFDPDAPPQSAGIPMILGNTHDETRTLIGRGDPSLFQLTWTGLLPKLLANSPFMGDLDRADVIARYRRIYPHYTPTDVFFAATTASRSWRGQVIEAERRARQAVADRHTWVFQFDWRSPIEGGRWGAHHGLDVPFVFDNVVNVPEKVGTRSDASTLSGLMSDACIAFARSHKPDVSGLPSWPVYDLTRRETMIFDSRCRIEADPRGDERRLFDVVPYVQPGT